MLQEESHTIDLPSIQYEKTLNLKEKQKISKVVLERESIRTLCDKLRRERDRAVSELAEALRDSDEGKKLRNETVKENKELR